jgi:hypothetical protein
MNDEVMHLHLAEGALIAWVTAQDDEYKWSISEQMGHANGSTGRSAQREIRGLRSDGRCLSRRGEWENQQGHESKKGQLHDARR